MMTNHITNNSLTYQIDLPSLWNFPACWLSLCEEIVEDLDMACGHGNLLTLGCCTSWHQLAPAGTSWPQLAPAGPRWVKQPVKTLMHNCMTSLGTVGVGNAETHPINANNAPFANTQIVNAPIVKATATIPHSAYSRDWPYQHLPTIWFKRDLVTPLGYPLGVASVYATTPVTKR